MEGYPVSVFEAMPVAGGMLRLGVPEYRLPTEIVEREVQDIVALGVELNLNSRVDNLDDLFKAGFDAVLIAVGAHEGIKLRIPGAGLDGVLVNTHFLRDVRLGRYSHVEGDPGVNESSDLGKRVLVLGGGNVAIDCARSAVRLGARSTNGMPGKLPRNASPPLGSRSSGRRGGYRPRRSNLRTNPG